MAVGHGLGDGRPGVPGGKGRCDQAGVNGRQRQGGGGRRGGDHPAWQDSDDRQSELRRARQPGRGPGGDDLHHGAGQVRQGIHREHRRAAGPDRWLHRGHRDGQDELRAGRPGALGRHRHPVRVRRAHLQPDSHHHLRDRDDRRDDRVDWHVPRGRRHRRREDDAGAARGRTACRRSRHGDRRHASIPSRTPASRRTSGWSRSPASRAAGSA